MSKRILQSLGRVPDVSLKICFKFKNVHRDSVLIFTFLLKIIYLIPGHSFIQLSGDLLVISNIPCAKCSLDLITRPISPFTITNSAHKISTHVKNKTQ